MIGTSQLINAFGAPVCFTDTTDIFKDGSGVALYGLDYDASDAGGTSGKFGEAAIFNGSSSYINLNHSTTYSDLTISAWVNVTSTSSRQTIVGRWWDGSNRSITFLMESGGVLKLITSSTGADTVITTGGTLTANTWHFVCFTFQNGGDVTITLDSSTTTTTQNTSINNNNQNWLIGMEDYRGNDKWNGSIDQVRVYDSALTQSQVTQLYQENSSTVGTHLFGCIANYNLDGSAKESMGTTAYDGTETDITYRYDGTPTAVDFGVGGKINYGARFNGSSSRINTGYQIPSGLSGFSVSAWVKAATDKTQYIVGDLGTGGASGDGMFQINISSSNVLRAAVGGTGSQTIATISNYIGTWTHIVVTTDSSGNIIGYVNGSQVGTATGNALSSNTRDFIIGMFGDTSHSTTFDGSIDQVRIFSKELSSDEVGKLYGNGAGEIACAYTSTTDIVNYPSDTTPVAYYKLDNSSEDYSTGGNDGTATNIEYRFGRYGQAAVFNGTNSYIYASNPVQQPTTNFSVSVWSKWDSKPSGSVGLVGNFKSGVNPQVGFALAKSNGSNVFGFFADGTATNGNVQGTTNFVINRWYHVVGTYDGSNIKIYVDGQLEGTQAYTATPGTTDQPLVIGRWYGNYSGYYHDGSIDQVRIYSTALTSSQVTKLYEEKQDYITKDAADPFGDSNSVALYEMENNVNDTSGNNNNGTTSNVTFTSTDPIRGTYEATFNGSTNDIGLPQVMGQNNYTFSAWFKTDALNDFQTIFSLNANGSYKKAIFLHSGGTNNIRIYSALNNYYSSNNIYNTNQWYHIVFTKSSTNGIVVYLDANEIINEPTATANDPLSTQGSDFIGAYQTSTAEALHFDGSIDQVRIFDRALDGTEAYQLYAEGARGTGL